MSACNSQVSCMEKKDSSRVSGLFESSSYQTGALSRALTINFKSTQMRKNGNLVSYIC